STAAPFGDVQFVPRRYPDPECIVQLSLGAERAITAEAGDAGPSHRRDDSVPIDAANPLILRIGDVEIPSRVEGKAFGVVELRGGSRPAVPFETTRAG